MNKNPNAEIRNPKFPLTQRRGDAEMTKREVWVGECALLAAIALMLFIKTSGLICFLFGIAFLTWFMLFAGAIIGLVRENITTIGATPIEARGTRALPLN